MLWKRPVKLCDWGIFSPNKSQHWTTTMDHSPQMWSIIRQFCSLVNNGSWLVWALTGVDCTHSEPLLACNTYWRLCLRHHMNSKHGFTKQWPVRTSHLLSCPWPETILFSWHKEGIIKPLLSSHKYNYHNVDCTHNEMEEITQI